MNDMPIERVLLIGEADFRLVKVVFDGTPEYILEVRDGIDAMGNERWRKFEINGTAMKALFRYLIRIADKETESA